MSAPASPGFVVVTRFTRDDGTVVVHAYGGPLGSYPTRSRAKTSVAHMLREGDTAQQVKDGRLEISVTKVVAL